MCFSITRKKNWLSEVNMCSREFVKNIVTGTVYVELIALVLSLIPSLIFQCIISATNVSLAFGDL